MECWGAPEPPSFLLHGTGHILDQVILWSEGCPGDTRQPPSPLTLFGCDNQKYLWTLPNVFVKIHHLTVSYDRAWQS